MNFHQVRQLRELGERDAQAGKSIDAYYDAPGVRHNEVNRAAYEIGYRAAKAVMRSKKEKQKP